MSFCKSKLCTNLNGLNISMIVKNDRYLTQSYEAFQWKNLV